MPKLAATFFSSKKQVQKIGRSAESTTVATYGQKEGVGEEVNGWFICSASKKGPENIDNETLLRLEKLKVRKECRNFSS